MLHDYSPMNSGALMDRVFDLYKAAFKTHIAFALIVAFVSFAILTVLAIALLSGIAINLASTGNFSEENIITIAFLVIAAIIPLYMCWMFLSASGHILISKQAFFNERIELPFKETFRAFLRVMSAALAQVILSAPWLILLAIFIYFSARDSFNFILNINPVAVIVGSFAISILYIIYSNIFALSVPVAIFEKRIFFGTVSRSFNLIKKDFWRILGLRLLWTLLAYLFSYSAQGLVIVLMAILAYLAGNVVDFEYILTTTSFLQYFSSIIIGVLIRPLDGIMTALIYFNQKIKKEGFDIEIGLQLLARKLP